jgi:hypothetical protein
MFAGRMMTEGLGRPCGLKPTRKQVAFRQIDGQNFPVEDSERDGSSG